MRVTVASINLRKDDVPYLLEAINKAKELEWI